MTHETGNGKNRLKPAEKKSVNYWYEVVLLVPPVWEEILPDALEQMGFSGIWIEEEKTPPYRSVVKAYLSESVWHADMAERIAAHLERISQAFSQGTDKGEFTFRLIEEEDWASKWLPFFTPIKIGPVWIRPKEKEIDLLEGEKEIVINPGQAFGTGHHETTRLCLEALLWISDKLGKNIPILDLGTGSGILAMFAAKIGFHNILALDNDPVAVETARKNLVINGFYEGIDRPVHIEGRSITVITEQFSLILANLTTRDLVALAPTLVKRTAEGGWLIFSGILATEAGTVIDVYRRENAELMEQRSRGDWACLVFKKSAL